jgi:hypothetical protein
VRTTTEPVEVRLTLDRAADPIGGLWQAPATGRGGAFWGWLELMSALQGVCDQADAPTAPGDAPARRR